MTKITNEKAKELRKDFPILQEKSGEKGKSLIYLDNAATTQKPQQVIQAITDFYSTTNANIHRGVYKISEEATRQYEEAHKVVARFINASSKQEVIFTRNCTESVNLLAYTLHPLIVAKEKEENQKRNEILVTEMEHHSNLVPWQQFAQRHGMTLKYIKMKDDFTLDYEDAQQKITENTALVSLVHVSNSLGTVNDVKRIIGWAKEKGALTIVDAAQSVPHMNIDVQAMGCDFLTFSAHKMLGPTGMGVLYGRKELLEKMPPFLYGGDMIRKVTYEDATWNDLPWKFEAGTPNIAGGIVFATAIKYLESIGMENIEAWEKELTQYALTRMKDVPGIKIYHAGPENSAGIISFTIDGMHPHDVASLMDDASVCVRGGHHCTMPLMDKLGITGSSRVSFYLYNTLEDVDTFIETLKKAQELFK
jgi:cysteine desulfurase / selenocysteine lyase